MLPLCHIHSLSLYLWDEYFSSQAYPLQWCSGAVAFWPQVPWSTAEIIYTTLRCGSLGTRLPCAPATILVLSPRLVAALLCLALLFPLKPPESDFWSGSVHFVSTLPSAVGFASTHPEARSLPREERSSVWNPEPQPRWALPGGHQSDSSHGFFFFPFPVV